MGEDICDSEGEQERSMEVVGAEVRNDGSDGTLVVMGRWKPRSAAWLLLGALACASSDDTSARAAEAPGVEVTPATRPGVEPPATSRRDEERLAIVFRSDVPRAAVETLVGALGASVAAEHERERIYWLRIDAPERERASILERLRAAPDVEVVTDDPEGHFERWRMQKPPLRATE